MLRSSLTICQRRERELDSPRMFTYDNILKEFEGDKGLDSIFTRQGMPHVMEVGETCDYWVFVNRRSKSIVLMSKVNGASTPCTFGDASKHGISQGQIRAAQDALKMWPLENEDIEKGVPPL